MRKVMPTSVLDVSSARKPALSGIARSATRQSGAIAIMSAFAIIIILGFFALALDLSRIYNRRVEMHALASSVAIAAAKPLNGTKEGIDLALAAARSVVEGRAHGPRYEYGKSMTWIDSAMSFSASSDGATGWRSDAEAKNSPDGLLYVKVDTSALDAAYGQVDLFFAPIFSSSLASVHIADNAVAGKSRLNVTPIGICAMSDVPREKREHPAGAQYDELVEYGFRRGISYDLMNLNPKGTTPISFQINPARLAGNSSPSTYFTPWFYRQYICTGTMAIPKIVGEKVDVQSPFPIDDYVTHLNSRFDPYSGTCDVHTSPPDSNVKQYTFGSVSWMTPKGAAQSAAKDSTNITRLQTIAELGPPNHSAAADYGPLWTFARAVPWSSYESKGEPEPVGGYPPFDATTTVWKALYGTTSSVGTYPSSTPYRQTSGSAYFLAPTSSRRPGLFGRRVLNIPLLSCPVTGSEADVLAIARFLMTVPATSTSLYAEFGGINTNSHVAGLVEVYQ